MLKTVRSDRKTSFATQQQSRSASIIYNGRLTSRMSLTAIRDNLSRGLSGNMFDATQHALEIYFYRRTYDLDAILIQRKFPRVRDCLLRYDRVDAGTVHGSSGFPWPAFIAACKAQDPETQLSFSGSFRDFAHRSESFFPSLRPWKLLSKHERKADCRWYYHDLAPPAETGPIAAATLVRAMIRWRSPPLAML